jgi:hypothetical protein
MKNKKLFIIILICTINISLFASENYYWDFSSSLPDTYDLQEIAVTDLYYPNSGYIDYGTEQYNGYYMGQVVVDFSESTNSIHNKYVDLFKDTYKNLSLTQEGGYFYSPSSYIYGGRTVVSDSSENQSTVSGFIHITKKDKYGTILNSDWYNTTDPYTIDFSSDYSYKNITTDSFTFEYYFIVNNMEDLNTDEDWNLYIPDKTGEWSGATLRFGIINGGYLWGQTDYIGKSCIRDTFFTYNPVYAKSGTFPAGNTPISNDVYSLNIEIQKKFNDTSTDFFDGKIHDYYSLDFDSYKYERLTENPFSLCIEISSVYDWNIHLDNKVDASEAEKIKYKLYLKYKKNNNYSTMEIKKNQDKILIKNIVSSNSSSIIYLATKSDSAKSNTNIKGTYQDTVYINFITDGWDNGEENQFAEKVIDLSN